MPTLDGNVPYTVREGTQPGETFRLKGKGFPYINGRGRGDEVVRVTVEVPKNLTSEQKKLLHAFEESLGDKNYQKRRSFFDKLPGRVQLKTPRTEKDRRGKSPFPRRSYPSPLALSS